MTDHDSDHLMVLNPLTDHQAQVSDPTDPVHLTILEAAAVLVEVVADGVEAAMAIEEAVVVLATEEVVEVLMVRQEEGEVRYHFYAR